MNNHEDTFATRRCGEGETFCDKVTWRWGDKAKNRRVTPSPPRPVSASFSVSPCLRVFFIKNLKSKIKNILFFAFCLLLTTNGEAAVKRQKVTVGMHNTYSINDGNLGRSEPDLKEVWEGVPGVSDFEACNITMHYWPRPGDLPDVEPGGNSYSAWWIDYMEEAYNLTNQNGEVRLRVIVGPLYSFYVVYKGDFFNEFIEDLCRWEKGSKYSGTLAGWYLTEEPMGSTHNFDPEVCNEMAEAIKAVEKSVETHYHTMYMDTAVEGLYFSESALAAFARPADVVMISSSTYAWETSAQQPVYEPNWNTIHGPMKQLRNIVYADRRRRNLPLPEIHVVLEARDAKGHGQPTNWEMRQQIHIALSQSFLHNDPPADGVWFFWWSEIARNARDNTDDWNYGRRIAEAIQTQVARSTFAESPWVRKVFDPDKTRFRFPEFGSFNPATSCIPYDLAEPGYVRVEIFDEKMSPVKKFDMKYQVAGELQRFGGPYWYREGAPNGFYIFRLYLNSKLMDEVKVKVQWSVVPSSSSHQLGVWSNNNMVEVQWEPQPEEQKGLGGYSILLSTSQDDYPDYQMDLEPAITSLRSAPLPDGDSNYFHIRSMDGAGNWSAAVHLGPFYIDTTGPGNVKNLASDSHEIGKWSRNNRINLHWNPADDASSGVKSYSVLWDGSPGTLPDEKIDISSDATILASEPLDDGKHYFHIRSVDNAGNWAYTAAHIGPFLIDTLPPEGVTDLLSSSHIPNQWSSDDIVIINWKTAEDMESGIGGYSALWDSSADTIPGESVNVDGRVVSLTSPPLKSSKESGYYFHIRSVDRAGNWARDSQHLGPFMIDTEPPPKIEGLVSTSHKPDEWSPLTSVDLTWIPRKGSISGIAGYEWSISRDEHEGIALQPPLHIPQLSDGLWYIHVRAVDNAGNAGAPEHITLKIDSTPPASPVIWSSSHPNDNVWYTSPEATFEWAAEDKMSGVAGYNWSWDTEAETIPDEVKAGSAGVPPATLTALSPGLWYFHLRAVDNAGNWSEPSHYRIQVDPSAPPAPQIGSDTHRSSEWVARSDVRLSWKTPVPGPSGIVSYSYSLDHNPYTTPDDVPEDGVRQVEYLDLPDGIWYFHCRAESGSGLWGPAAHCEIMIDTVPPEITITYPQDGKWYTHPITEYTWTLDDRTSGADWSTFEYSYNGGTWTWFRCDAIKQRGDTVAPPGIIFWGDMDEIPDCMEAEDDTLQVRVRDYAGNLGVSNLVTIRVDRSTSLPTIMSSTHPDQDKWYIANDPDFAWDFEDHLSGADSYSWALDHSETTVPPQIRMIEGHITSRIDITGLSDGIWYFHLRARDRAGNWSEPSHYRIKIDATTPTAKLKISGPAIADRDPPLVRSGPVEVILQTSETVFEPVLEYKPASAGFPVKIELTGHQNEWKGVFNVTIRTGEGKAVFLFSARDEAGNVGREITAGSSFVVDTLIRADTDETVEVLCIDEPETKIALLPGAISQNLRIEIVKDTSHLAPGMIAIYDFTPYNSRMKKLKGLTFRTPVEITFSPNYLSVAQASLPVSDMDDSAIGVYYWDEVKWHKVQDVYSQDATVRVDYPGRFALMKSDPMTSGIMYGWAAPNPFTPNGSGDATDRVIFHVATKYVDLGEFEVKIYDLNGRLVKILEGGRKAWDGTDENGRIVEGGLYIYQIHLGDQVISGTVVVLK